MTSQKTQDCLSSAAKMQMSNHGEKRLALSNIDHRKKYRLNVRLLVSAVTLVFQFF